MKNLAVLFLTILTLNCFGAGVTVSSLNGFATNLTLVGPITGLGAYLTNQTKWSLYTNRTAYSNGKWYSFSNSVTAGFDEIDNLSGNYPTNSQGGNDIELQAGAYTFTEPIVLSHNTKITGAGQWATVIKYTGTNRFTTNAVMMSVPNFDTHFPLNGEDDDNAGQLTNAALIRLMQIDAINGWGANYMFKDFAVQNASNQACILIGGLANNLYEDGLGSFGPDIFTTNSFGADLQYAATLPNAPSLVVGQAVFAIQTWLDANGLMLGLADGDLNIGNSYYNSFNEGAYFIGQDPNSLGINGYPTTNWLSVGVAIFSGEIANFGASIKSLFPYFNNADIWIHGSPCDIEDGYWQNSNHNLLVSGDCNVFNKEAPNQLSTRRQILYDGTVFTMQNLDPINFTNGLVQTMYFSSSKVGGFFFNVNGLVGVIDGGGWEGNVNGLLSGNGSGITNATTTYATNDIINGSTNVNTLTHAVLRTIPVVASSPAATLGHAEIDAQLFIGNAWITVDDCSDAFGGTGILHTNKSTLKFVVPSGGSFRLTNNLSGTGYTAGLNAGATNTYTILP